MLEVYFFDESADIIGPLMNVPMGINPTMKSFIIPGVNMSIDLGQFMCELIKFRGGDAYDKAFLHQAVSLVVDHSMSVYFINALNSFMMTYGLTTLLHLSVLEFNHIYIYFNDSTTGTTEVHEMDSATFETRISDSASFNIRPAQTYQPEDVYDEMEDKLEEVIKLIPKIPSEKLDIALSLVLKKTYVMDKKIRDRMYEELTDVKAQVEELKMNRQQVQEQENATKKVQIFLGRK